MMWVRFFMNLAIDGYGNYIEKKDQPRFATLTTVKWVTQT
jgi:hypothetical protein